MQRFAETCERVAATSKKLEKTAIVAEYLRSRGLADVAISAVFLSGRAFPSFEERTLQIGGSLLWKVVQDLTGASDAELSAGYRRRGDLGAAVCDVLTMRALPPPKNPLRLADVRQAFDQIAETRTAVAKGTQLQSLLERSTPLEAKYILKIISGELRIGLKESLVEEAIARAYDEPLAQVQRANMLLGDIGEILRLAAGHRLGDTRMRLFHPIGFMLASPVADAAEAFAYFEQAQVEDKYDGIRAQAHCGGGQVRLFSRTLDEVTPSVPELLGPLSEFASEIILDGEIVAWREPPDVRPGSDSVSRNSDNVVHNYDNVGYPLPFSELQKRLGRRQVSPKLIAEVPVAYVVFDVLYAEGELMLERTLAERTAVLDRVFAGATRVAPHPVAHSQGRLVFEAEVGEQPASGWILRAPSMQAGSPEQLEQFFEQAMARGNEGLMIKDLQSPYLPGRRGRWWLKLKRELATLDVVVTSAEFGNGKRAQVLSDYTFAVRKGEELVNIGKAYSGLTDAEIAELTQWFFAHTIADHGHVRQVEPKMVLEVAFNAIMRSDRHDSGYALRFPRIVRIRKDKTAAEIDTVETVENIYRRQHGRNSGEQ